MKELEKYNIEIGSLKNKTYSYKFEGEKLFFELFPDSLVNDGSFIAEVDLTKSEVMIRLDFNVSGKLKLTCDRSLELFDYPFQSENLQIIQFGDRHEELSDEMEVIPKGIHTINIAHYIYELINLAVPMKKLHPKFQDEDSENPLIYSSEDTEEEKKDDIDPRWAVLKNLKDKNKK